MLHGTIIVVLFVTLQGKGILHAVHVEIEVDTDRTLPTFTVRESKEHVLAAIKNTGYQLATPPRHRQSRTGGSS